MNASRAISGLSAPERTVTHAESASLYAVPRLSFGPTLEKVLGGFAHTADPVHPADATGLDHDAAGEVASAVPAGKTVHAQKKSQRRK